MNQQFVAAYCSDVLLASIRLHYKENTIQAAQDLLHSLSYFDADIPANDVAVQGIPQLFSLASVIHNLIQRGAPTRTSPIIEEYLKGYHNGITYTKDDLGAFYYEIPEVTKDFSILMLRSLFIVDPRIGPETLSNGYWTQCLSASELEQRFMKEHVVDKLGAAWIQLIEPQRSVTNILKYAYESGEYVRDLHNQPIDDFGEQRVDFAVELPCVFGDKKETRKGLVIEIDGSQHLLDRAQFNIDQYRDQAFMDLKNTNWSTLRIESRNWSDIGAKLNAFNLFFQDKYFVNIQNNYSNPIYSTEEGFQAITIALLPVAVARIHRVLVELILSGDLPLNKSVWKLGFVERDVDCAYIAIEDFKCAWNNLIRLSGYTCVLPEIEITVFDTKEFHQASIAPLDKQDVSKAKHFNGDFLFDISVLSRYGDVDFIATENDTRTISIRSSKSKKAIRNFIHAPLIKYHPVSDEQETDLLGYFIKTIFRKAKLRPGQLSIINRALQLQTVIGLLPTGGGKSLTYQLCSMLQPGVTLIVDPIKSLMQDQYDGLKRNMIDAVVFVNSSIKTYYERKWAQDQMTRGQVMFSFISPERLQIPVFRTALAHMHQTHKKYFSYCVIDEAHCVSEWGHDFRTSYLKLGENARRFCKTWGETNTISLFGLTATASFDVLSDVKRELRIEHENVVYGLGTRRDELLYRVVEVQTDVDAGEIGYAASDSVGNAKFQMITQLLNQLPDVIQRTSDRNLLPKKFNTRSFYTPNDKNKFDNAILVFCPHKSAKSPFGVERIASLLTRTPYRNVGIFYGSDDSDGDNKSLSELNQQKFVHNDLPILVATKAFGMGIDKSNVRGTIHLNFPSSIESFVQEAGRAGRDRKRAISYILYSDAPQVDRGVVDSFHNNSFRGIPKDFQMILELLDEISYPAKKVTNDLSIKVFEEFGEAIYIRTWVNYSNKRLYVNRAFQISYGYIDLDDLNISDKGCHESIDKKLAKELLEYLAEYIRKNANRQDYLTWINSVLIKNTQPGIEKILNKARASSPIPDIEVGFRNDSVREITDLLKDHISDSITETMVQSASNFAFEFDEFVKNLIKEVRNSTNENISEHFPLKDEKQVQLNRLYESIRNESDTFKAIYRLSIIGVIDDYEVDYAQKSIRIKLSKKTDEAYIQNYRTYLTKYLSPNNVEEHIAQLENLRQPTIIRKVAYGLVQYVYGFIGKKRVRAITDMEGLCSDAVSQEFSDGKMENRINLYFNSKYNEDLLLDTDDGKSSEIGLLKKYFQLTNGVVDELEHLRGSTMRILSDYPENGALLILNAYSNLLLETSNADGEITIRNNFAIDRAIEDLDRGISLLRNTNTSTFDILTAIRYDLLQHNPKMEQLLEGITSYISLREHNSWLNNINNEKMK